MLPVPDSDPKAMVVDIRRMDRHKGALSNKIKTNDSLSGKANNNTGQGLATEQALGQEMGMLSWTPGLPELTLVNSEV